MHKKDLIEKWLNGDLSAEEAAIFSKQDDFLLNERIVKTAKNFKASNFYNVKDFETFKKAYFQTNNKSSVNNWFKPLLRAACVIIISFGAYFLFFNSGNDKVYTLAKEKKEIELPDHSIVSLNALSEVEYDADNWNDKRQIYLKGEAFFKVEKGKQFDVITSDGTVSVVGTAFNVKQRENYFEVKCYEGIVKVQSDTIIRKLTIGKVYQILNGKFVEEGTIDKVPLWTENRSKFKAIPLKNIIDELERQYGIEVTYKDLKINRLFTGGFGHDNLEDALIAITKPLNLSYLIDSSNQVLIYGNK